MFVLRLVAAIWCCSYLALTRKIPYYDTFDDDFYSELRNLLEEHQSGKGAPPVAHPREVRGWGEELGIGQVAGVSVDPDGHPVVFHRGGRVWDYTLIYSQLKNMERDVGIFPVFPREMDSNVLTQSVVHILAKDVFMHRTCAFHMQVSVLFMLCTCGSFNSTHHYQEVAPLDDDVVVVLDAQTGLPLPSWGRGKFLLPHGITVDAQGNTWLTDVGLHQVFKFPLDAEEPSLTLGHARMPGSGDHHFCKPTSVAVAASGEFFVADGYCNGRILRFHADGALMAQFGHMGSDGSSRALYVPHGLALDDSRDALCVADRENRRVLCLRAGLRHVDDFGEAFMTLQEPNQGRVFDIATVNGVVVGVAGSEDEGAATGFTADLSNGKLLDAWGPLVGFHNPHAVAVSRDGSAIYVSEIGPNRIWKFLLESPAAY
ncbi:LOW QUALITY PROTEIN: peptidyl-alpha-hydroxyglycine alpha-amidating lyase 2-like [Penaeus monodon]|uniref:LOW QUALITY PROTEIN: peptidyl-alpha-hydroxyglycine alpha-amidating lyase 2-like n=1 Tax=Penaeus monodon TaxID=6687 RepID=UPI0018A7603E|nr:LOW QUALITY PROTEIN: peptidyl-alpha-hydroxyglycine alpha-amidating lyase 2-like [Penaeus monodon]